MKIGEKLLLNHTQAIAQLCYTGIKAFVEQCSPDVMSDPVLLMQRFMHYPSLSLIPTVFLKSSDLATFKERSVCDWERAHVNAMVAGLCTHEVDVLYWIILFILFQSISCHIASGL